MRVEPRAYYNDSDKDAAHVLRCLADEGLIMPGDVDDRSIKEVQPDDLKGYTQCHFFAGAGLWSVAARLAGWPDERPIWTGSCPCQGESFAGKRLGRNDPRHLWPDFFRLICAARPPIVMGEQVAAAAGTHWLDRVIADLESEDYAARAVDIPACAVDAPTGGQRLYFVASTDTDGCSRFSKQNQWAQTREQAPRWHNAYGCSPDAWASSRAVVGVDGRSRRVEPGIPILAHGVAGASSALRLGGNSISPILAAEVIGAFLDAEAEELGEVA